MAERWISLAQKMFLNGKNVVFDGHKADMLIQNFQGGGVNTHNPVDFFARGSKFV